MNEDTSILEIFQDPLLTFIALVMLSTVWVVIPGEYSEISPEMAQKRMELDEMEQHIAELEKKIEQAQKSLKRGKDEIASLKSDLASEKGNKASEEQFEEKIASLKQTLEWKRKELNRLEKELANRKGNDVRKLSLAEVDRMIRFLRDEVVEKEALLQEFRRKPAEPEGTAKDAPKAAGLDAMRERVKQEKNEIEEVEQEIQRNKQLLRTRSGVGAYSTAGTRGKNSIGFELSGDSVFLIDERNYNVEVYAVACGGSMARAFSLTRKPNAVGESISMIGGGGSIFQRELSNNSPGAAYVSFVVRGSAFHTFQKAREIAWKKGYRVAWSPLDSGVIRGSSCGTALAR